MKEKLVEYLEYINKEISRCSIELKNQKNESDKLYYVGILSIYYCVKNDIENILSNGKRKKDNN